MPIIVFVLRNRCIFLEIVSNFTIFNRQRQDTNILSANIFILCVYLKAKTDTLQFYS